MIKEILLMINSKGLLSKREIAERIGVQESLLDNIFSLLISRGYLEKISIGPEACMNCPLRSVCSMRGRLRARKHTITVYAITEKGRRYLENATPK